MSNKKHYKNTKVNWAVTQGQIQKLMETFGVTGSRWTTISNDDGSFIIRFEFIYIISDDVGDRQVPCRIDVPIPDDSERNRLMRTLFWFLKSKLESIEDDFKEFEEEFLPYIVLPGDVTIYEAMLPGLKSGDLEKMKHVTLKALTDGGKK